MFSRAGTLLPNPPIPDPESTPVVHPVISVTLPPEARNDLSPQRREISVSNMTLAPLLPDVGVTPEITTTDDPFQPNSITQELQLLENELTAFLKAFHLQDIDNSGTTEKRRLYALMAKIYELMVQGTLKSYRDIKNLEKILKSALIMSAGLDPRFAHAEKTFGKFPTQLVPILRARATLVATRAMLTHESDVIRNSLDVWIRNTSIGEIMKDVRF